MRCEPWHDLISARIDNEATAAESDALDTHLATCAACRAWERQALALARHVRVRPARPVPDLSPRIVAAAGVGAARARFDIARWLLAWVALAELVLAVPALVLGDDSGASEHVARHIGSFDVAFAIGLLVAALHPARARAILPLAIVLTGCMALSTGLDLADGSTTVGLEAHHLIEIAGFVLLWFVAGKPRPAHLRFA